MTIQYGGYMGKILRVDLSRQKVVVEELKKSFVDMFIGGKGYAYFLYNSVEPKIDPFDPSNKVIFATGPLTGTTASGFAGRHVVITKSPLTSLFLDTYAGGFFGARLKFSGYDAIIIEGRSEKPVFLWVHDGEIEIRKAEHLWGKMTDETEVMVKEEIGEKEASVARIGPAGEKLVRFASVIHDEGRDAGRGGAGAVLGSKRLKAIAVSGTSKPSVVNPEKLEEAYKNIKDMIKKNPATAEVLPNFGTPGFVGVANALGGWAVKCYTTGVFEGADSLSGEYMKENFVVKRASCFGCTIGCRKICEIKSGPYAGTKLDGPEFESICLLGANCSVSSLETVAYAACLCDQYGMDTISTGSVISLAMMLCEKGILKAENLGKLKIGFGSGEALINLVKSVGERTGLGDILAEGSKRMAEKLGKEAEYYASHVKGLECPAWDPRAFWGHALSLSIGDRGACHTHSATLGLEIGGVLDRFSIENKAKSVKETEELNAANDTLIHCIFWTHFVPWLPEYSAEILNAVTGMNMDGKRFIMVGERILNLTRMFNVREGITRRDDALPKRLMEQPHLDGPSKGKIVTREMLNKMLDDYYKLRGWNKDGIPTEEKKRELNLLSL
ncbi:MAG: aldehyde ferredoxin oxidoreductase family protein [Candidatus Bathyarchaeia archaeon]